MPLDVRIINGSTTYYLVNSSGSPTVGGGPTSAASTPYSLNAAAWTQTAAPRRTIYTGGPPFAVGSRPLLRGWGNVTETVEIGVAGADADNVALRIRQLRQLLNSALVSAPALLYWQPHGASNPVYFEIYSADVQETGDWQNPAAGFTSALCRVTWTRSAFGGRLSSGQTAISGSSFGSSGIGSSSFIPGMYGDLIYEGQPLNVSAAESSGTTGRRLFAATLGRSANSSTTGAGAKTTSSTSGLQIAQVSGGGAATFANVSEVLSGQALTVRIVVSLGVTASANNAEIRYEIRASSPGNPTLYQSPWLAARPSGATWATTVLYDLGGYNPAALADYNSTGANLDYRLYLRSTDGASTTVTYNASYWLLPWTWCIADIDYTGGGADSRLNSFTERSGFAALPLRRPIAGSVASGTINSGGLLRGSPPIYISGGVLWLAWGLSDTLGQGYLVTPGTGGTLTVTATQAPLYTTLRGAE